MTPRFRRTPTSMAGLAAASVLLASGLASAADPSEVPPTVSQCLAASDASLKADNEHRLRAERDQLLVCAAASCPAEVRAECQRRGDEVNRRMPTVTFTARDERGADLATLRIIVDEEDLGQQRTGTPLAMDPGVHDLVFESVGLPKVMMKLVFVQGQKARPEQVLFAAAPAAIPASSPAPASEHPGSTQRWIGVGVGVAGIVGLGVGTAFGILAISRKSAANGECPGVVCQNQTGLDDWNSAAHAGTASTISLIAGGALLAGGAALWLTAPRPNDTGVGLGLGPGQVRLDATF